MKKTFPLLVIILLFISCSSDNYDDNQNSFKFTLEEHKYSDLNKNYQIWFFYDVQEEETAEDLKKRGPSYKSDIIHVGNSVYIKNIPVGMCAIYIVAIKQDQETVAMVLGYEIKPGENEIGFAVP